MNDICKLKMRHEKNTEMRYSKALHTEQDLKEFRIDGVISHYSQDVGVVGGRGGMPSCS